VGGYAPLFILALLIAMWPMFYNGFPVVYDDTGVYLGSPGDLYPPFPHFYTAFVFLLRSAGSLYLVVAVQALLTVYTLTIATAKLALRPVSAATIVPILLLLLVTQLPWLVSTIMPDFLLGLGVAALLTLCLRFRDLAFADRTLLFAVATGAAVSATANALVMIPFVFLILIAVRMFDGRADRKGVLFAAAFVTFATALPIAANTIIFHRTTYAIGSSARLFSKFVDKRIAVPYLEQECGRTHYVACDFLPQMRGITEGEGFLWAGLADESGAWFDRSGDFARLNRRIIAERPGTVAAIAAQDVLTLAQRPTLFAPEGRDFVSHSDPADPARAAVAATEPQSLRALLAAHQQNESIARRELRRSYEWMTLAGIALTLVTLIAAVRRRDHQMVKIALLVVAAVVISTAIHGGLSTPVARYMVKVSWLLWLVPTIGAIRARQHPSQPGVPQSSTGHAISA
jgi:hypothetical protein